MNAHEDPGMEALRRMVADKRQAERTRRRNHVDLDRDVTDSRDGARVDDEPGPPEPPDEDHKQRDRAVNGATFILDAPKQIPALWGHGDEVLWPEGEALMIAGGMGLGKTTLAGQLARARLFGGDVLGLPVAATDETILYLAMDRPQQIARSMRRQFTDEHRGALAARMIVRPGPPDADLAKQPMLLAGMAEHYNAGVVFVDSLKDAAIGLSDDEVGAAYNRARQNLLTSGRQLCELHHPVKHGAKGAPSTVIDVYGSTWLTAGCGSVIMLTGEPGDPIVGFRHIKQPVAEIGPYRLLNDQTAGELSLYSQTDLLALATAGGPNGVTAKTAATALFDTDKPDRNQIEKARRRLDRKTDEGVLVKVEGSSGGRGGGREAAWFPAN